MHCITVALYDLHLHKFATTIYYSGSHKMKFTTHALFRVATCHRGSHTRNGHDAQTGVWHSKQGCDAHNRGVTLIIALVRWQMLLWKLLGWELCQARLSAVSCDIGASWRQGGWNKLSVGVHLMASLSCPYWRRSWTGCCRSKLEVGRLRAVHQHSFYGFPSNRFVNIWACTCYKKYPSGIMIAPLGVCLSRTIIIPSWSFPKHITPIQQQLLKTVITFQHCNAIAQCAKIATIALTTYYTVYVQIFAVFVDF